MYIGGRRGYMYIGGRRGYMYNRGEEGYMYIGGRRATCIIGGGGATCIAPALANDHCSILSIYSCSHHPEDRHCIGQIQWTNENWSDWCETTDPTPVICSSSSKLTIYGVSH